jgi:[acyl-carrier-protein] S-malonyltransferase
LKIAFLFPGQGSQYAGMGRDLFETSRTAKAVFDEADSALGFALSRLCFEGPEEQLRLTANAQPAILTVSVAAAEVLREHGTFPDYVAGHSLGECSALVAVRSLRLGDAVRLVRKRGEYMQEAAPLGKGAMAAFLGAEAGLAEEICREAAKGEVLSVANLNSPAQVVIAGDAPAVARAIELAGQRGVRRAVLLKVSAPFHSALMRPAEERLALELNRLAIRDPEVPLVNNVEARTVTTSAEIRDGLKRQMSAPVHWEASMRALLREGATLFIEVGPGRVLSGLMRQIEPNVECLHVEDAASLGETLDRIKKIER